MTSLLWFPVIPFIALVLYSHSNISLYFSHIDCLHYCLFSSFLMHLDHQRTLPSSLFFKCHFLVSISLPLSFLLSLFLLPPPLDFNIPIAFHVSIYVILSRLSQIFIHITKHFWINSTWDLRRNTLHSWLHITKFNLYLDTTDWKHFYQF